MKIKFKLLPFTLSLLIVLGVTFGICWYSYNEFDKNVESFYSHYFHEEDYEDYDTTELIKNAVEFQYNEYIKASTTVSLHGKTGTNAPTYSNGTIHVPGYFDIDIYITNSISEGESTYCYYFYFYNVNYKSSTYDPSAKVSIILVEGAGTYESENEDDEVFGDTLLDKELDKMFDGADDNDPKYNGLYPYSDSFNEKSYYIYDNGFTGDEKNENVTIHPVYRCAPRQNALKEEIFNDSVPSSGTVTFAIVSSEGTTDYEELVRGKITDIDKLSEIEYEEGFASDIEKAGYSDFVTPKIFFHGGIAFILSAIIAVLFYLLWMDPKDQNKTSKFVQKKKNKK